MLNGIISKHLIRRFTPTTIFLASLVSVLRCQDLSPRAYVITPLHSNAVVLTYAYFSGSLLFNGAAPVTGATGMYGVPILAYYHSFGFFGRSSNLNVAVPYAVGTFQGSVAGVNEKIYRSGLVDTAFRFAVNLKGGPALHAQEFGRWKEKALLGASVKLIVPTGQYDPTRLINWGSNRWGFKPELGYSKRLDRWVLDAYAGGWLFTSNQRFFSPSGPKVQTESPIGSFEGHLSYDVRPRFWFSLDGNFWIGGLTSLNGLENASTRQTSSRIGLTAALPVGRHQSVKLSYSNGTYTRFGGNYQNISAAWQYSWLGRP